MEDYLKVFAGKNILITGGLGFIGSNLAGQLVGLKRAGLKLGKIVLVDALIPELGGNLFNISGIENDVVVRQLDIRNEKIKELFENTDYIFNLAGSVAHTGADSPEEICMDLELNLISQALFLGHLGEFLRTDKKKKPKVVYAGTRDEYGRIAEDCLPVKEDQAVLSAADLQGINKLAAGQYHLLLSRKTGFPVSWLRLTNTYGPRQSMVDKRRGILPWYIRKVLESDELEVWTDERGESSLRDFNYIDDVVDALIRVMGSEKTNGEIYNLGSCLRARGKSRTLCGNVLSVGDAAEKVAEIAGSGKVSYMKKDGLVYMGNFCADIGKINKDIGWKPEISLDEGLRRTIEYYRNPEVRKQHC